METTQPKIDQENVQKLDDFIRALNQKASERSTARNDFTNGYFVFDRPGFAAGGLSASKLEVLCRRLNIQLPSAGVLELIAKQGMSYTDLRQERHPFSKPPSLWEAEDFNRRTHIPTLAELGIRPYHRSP